ncbi:MAG TPA: hypothetical protein VG897_05715 [Terriglobales bacterium]|nr:hypothetical protein [Terriglobales bacterium]
MSVRSQVAVVIDRIKRLFKKEPPSDPHSYVTAPTKPRPPYRNSAAVAELDE